MKMEEYCELSDFLQQDIVAAEFTWTTFCSALSSFKKDFLVNPFPPDFKDNGLKDFKNLEEVVSRVQFLEHFDLDGLQQEEKRLLNWVLTKQRWKLRSVKDFESQLREIRASAEDECDPPLPQFMLEVVEEERSTQSSQRWPETWAFHGSALTNFYSILHHGLAANLNKTAAFGTGTYFSNELSVSLQWSPMGSPGQSRSSLGKRFGCIAVCRLTLDPSGATWGDSGQSAETVPSKYFVVKDDSLIRLQYLLVYAEPHPTSLRSGLAGRVERWLRHNWTPVLLLLYFLLLLFIGVANSRNLNFYVRRFSDYFTDDCRHYDHT